MTRQRLPDVHRQVSLATLLDLSMHLSQIFAKLRLINVLNQPWDPKLGPWNFTFFGAGRSWFHCHTSLHIQYTPSIQSSVVFCLIISWDKFMIKLKRSRFIVIRGLHVPPTRYHRRALTSARTAAKPSCSRTAVVINHQASGWWFRNVANQLRLIVLSSHSLQGLGYIQTVVLWDFWSINSIVSTPTLQKPFSFCLVPSRVDLL